MLKCKTREFQNEFQFTNNMKAYYTMPDYTMP